MLVTYFDLTDYSSERYLAALSGERASLGPVTQ
jgi:hypothetical protein